MKLKQLFKSLNRLASEKERGKIAIGIVLVVLLIAIVAFSGCVEEKEVTSSATSTPLAPTPTLSVTIEDIEEEIELLVVELGYDDEVAQHVAREVNSWIDRQGNPILHGWKEELSDAKERYEEGTISLDEFNNVEIKITKELSRKIKEEIPDYSKDNWHLKNVIRDKEANCLGNTQLFVSSPN